MVPGLGLDRSLVALLFRSLVALLFRSLVALLFWSLVALLFQALGPAKREIRKHIWGKIP